MQCPNCQAEIEDGFVFCPECHTFMDGTLSTTEAASEAAEIDRGNEVKTTLEEIEAQDKKLFKEVPACQVCGRQDETLRLVGYPYVLSFIIFTSRRSFAGIWCEKHRRQKLLLAGLATAGIGWLGIPFGIIYAPVALFQLAKGGKQPKEANVELLKMLAEDKRQHGDAEGARKCLEERLRFEEVADLRSERVGFYGTERATPGFLKKVGAVLWLFIFSALVGTAAGMLDIFISYLMGTVLEGSSLPWVISLISWSPMVILVVLAGLLVFQQINKTYRKTGMHSAVGAVLIGGLAGLIAGYSFSQGASMGDLLVYLAFNGTAEFESTAYFLGTLIYIAILGGVLWLQNFVGTGVNIDQIYIVLLAAGALFNMGMGGYTALKAAKWQKKVFELNR